MREKLQSQVRKLAGILMLAASRQATLRASRLDRT